MQTFGPFVAEYGVENHGIKNPDTVYWNLSTSMLYEQIIRRREGNIVHLGPIVVSTGDHTGRSPNDKFVVKEPTTADNIWWGKVNREYPQEKFDALVKSQGYVTAQDYQILETLATKLEARIDNLEKELAEREVK